MHRTLRRICLLLPVAAAVAPAAAQTPLGSEQRDLRNAAGDVWSIWTSPARATAHDLVPTAGAAALVSATSFGDSAVWAWMGRHQEGAVLRALQPIREGAKIPMYEFGSGQVLLPVSGALYLAGRLSHSVALRDAGTGCIAGHLASLGVREVVYLSVSRARPRVTPDPYEISLPGSSDWSWHSFLSGHIANSMACASFLAHRFSLGYGTPVPYAASAAIGLGRMADGRHWFSDTMAGAVLGFAIGEAIAVRQRERESRAWRRAPPLRHPIASPPHFLFFDSLSTSSKRIRRSQCDRRGRTFVHRASRDDAARASRPLEELHRSFVSLRGRACSERPQIAAVSRLGVLLSRIEPVLPRFEFANHLSSSADRRRSTTAPRLPLARATSAPAAAPTEELTSETVCGMSPATPCAAGWLVGMCIVTRPTATISVT